MKQRNEASYLKKFKNRGRMGESICPKYTHGNVVRQAGGRHIRRIHNALITNNDASRKVIDVLVNKWCDKNSKTVLPGSVPYGGYNPVNQQSEPYRRNTKLQNMKKFRSSMWRGAYHDSFEPQWHKDHRKPYERHVELTEIKHGLYLGTRDTADNFDTLNELGIKTVVNLSTNYKFSKFTSHQINFYNYPMKDDRYVSTKEFIRMTRKIANIIDKTEDPIMIVCGKGKNRSVAMIVAYAITHCGMKASDVLQYIEDVKEEAYGRYKWSNLDNLHFRRLLENIEQTN